LARIIPPTFPDRVCDITNFGAKPNDCGYDNTLPIRAAIDWCSSLGGGTVHVPPGVFITGAIYLKSNINLNLALGATLRFTRDQSKYPLVYTRWEGIELMNFSPFIYAFEEENLAITGRGTLDGNCDCSENGWWNWKGRGVTHPEFCGWKEGDPWQENDRNALFEMAENGTEVKDRIFGPGHYLRPQMIQPYRSKNILIEGVRILDSPMWIVHPVLCENVLIDGISIISHGPNSDGVDPESCKDVLIRNVYFDSGDDDIAIKSGRNGDGRRVNVSSENIVVQHCTMKDGHGALTLGSCISGGVKNVFFEDCQLNSPNLDQAIRFKNNALRGGTLENIYIRNIQIGQVAKAALEVDYYYEEGPNAPFVPILRNLQIENVHVTRKTGHAIFVKGYPTPGTSVIEGIVLRNCSFDGVQHENVIEFVNSMRLENVSLNGTIIDFVIP